MKKTLGRVNSSFFRSAQINDIEYEPDFNTRLDRLDKGIPNFDKI